MEPKINKNTTCVLEEMIIIVLVNFDFSRLCIVILKVTEFSTDFLTNIINFTLTNSEISTG